MAITVTFDPPLPSDSPSVFNTKAFTLLGDLNDWSTEANSLASTVSSNASTSTTNASNASTSADAAATSASNAAASYDSFDDRYLGSKSSAPTLDNDGAALLTGALYWDSVLSAMFVRTSGGAWTALNASTGIAQAITVNSSSAALTVTQTGAGNAFVVEDSASTDSTPFVIDASGRVGIGVSAPATGLHYDAVSGDAYVLVRGDTAARMHIRRYGTDANAAAFGLYKGRGTIAVPTMVASGDRLGDFTTYGYDGTQHVAAARIYVEVDDTPGTNDMPGRLVLSTTADGASSPTERMRVDSAGLITARNSTGLGYGAGSGGTVTQATSKATAVTLNKPSGQITTDNASLAAGATVSFTWNNSLFTATDTVVTSMKTGYGTFGSYSLEVENVSAGSATVVIKNNTGGSLSEAFTFSFAVIKGSTT